MRDFLAQFMALALVYWVMGTRPYRRAVASVVRAIVGGL